VLLDAGYRVILRPHYQTLRLTPGVMDRLRTRFGKHENIEYQERMAESDSLFRSQLLITDWSAMAIEYMLGLEKPVLYIDLPRRVRNPDWKTLGIEPLEVALRQQVGAIVSPQHLEEVPRTIEHLLGKWGDRKQSIAALRSKMIFNLGHSTPLGAREIARLADENARIRQTREQLQRGRQSG